MFILLIISGYLLNNSSFWYIGVSICGLHLTCQVIKLKNIEQNNPLQIFKSNVFLGLNLNIIILEIIWFPRQKS